MLELDDEDLSFVVSSLEDGAAELDEDDDGGVAVEPEPAEPLIVELDEELPGALDGEPLLMSTEVDDEVEPAGARVEPDGEVAELELERSAVRSQAAINEAPSARETATAIVESLMRPPWLGYKYWAANIGPRLLNR